MQRQLSDLVNQFEHAQARAESIAETIAEERWAVRNDSNSWSVGECFAHLNLTNAAYVPRVQKAIEEARKLPRFSGSYHRDFVGWLVGTLFGPLPSIGKMRIGKVKTTPPFVPTANNPKQTTIAEFLRLQLQLIAMVSECDGLAIDKVKIVSPFGEKISYSCFSTFRILPRHEERHLDQAEAVWG